MKITLVSNYLPPRAGGIEVVVDALAREYVANGHEVTVVGYAAPSHEPPDAPYARMPIGGWNGLEGRNVPLPIIGPRSSARIRRAMRGADAIHVHGLPYPSSLVALQLAPRNARVIVTEHVGSIPFDSSLLDRLQREALRIGLRLAARRGATVTVLNDRVTHELNAIRKRVNIVKVHNGVDRSVFRPPTTAERVDARAALGLSRSTVLVAARRSQKKRYDLVSEVARQLDGVDVLVCGHDTDLLENLPPNVRVFGEVDRDTIRSLYHAADLLLLPSEGEGVPLVLLEAMASGLPVVFGEDVDVARELPQSLVMSPREPTALAEVIKRLLDDDPERARLAQGALRDLEKYDWANVASVYRDLLTK